MEESGALVYDMVVLGAGIAGTITALCLSRAGVKTLVVEKKVHPRFAIGESTTPQTTMDVLKLAKEWDLPELANVSNYLGMKKAGLVTYPKELFWFGYNSHGAPLRLEDETISVTTLPPIGPDSHMLRSDVDQYLISLFPKYGVDYMENTAVTDFTTSDDADFVEIKLHSYNEPCRDTEVRCRFVVDCTGHNCYLARRYGLHHHDAHMNLRSRTIYAHFRTPPGWDLDAVCGGRNPYIHTKRDNGTMHHVFEGGWIWVIPFENNTVSVGIVLDLDMFPNDRSVSAEEEWATIIARFPTVQAHLGPLVPLRSFLRTGRIQITAETILGNRFILAPHAASFIDPLYSTGIALTMRFVRRFTPKAKEILSVVRSRDIPNPTAHIKHILLPLQKAFQMEVDHIDKIVAGTFDATIHPMLFRQYWRLWSLGATFAVLLNKDDSAGTLFCSDDPDFVKTVDQAYAIVHNFLQKVKAASAEPANRNKKLVVDEAEVRAVASQVKTLVDVRVDACHQKTLFDIVPYCSIDAPGPFVVPGGLSSEHQINLLTGRHHHRLVSFLLAGIDLASIRLYFVLGKIFGTRFRYGSQLVHLFAPHVMERDSRRVTPITIARRIYHRFIHKKL